MMPPTIPSKGRFSVVVARFSSLGLVQSCQSGPLRRYHQKARLRFSHSIFSTSLIGRDSREAPEPMRPPTSERSGFSPMRSIMSALFDVPPTSTELEVSDRVRSTLATYSRTSERTKGALRVRPHLLSASTRAKFSVTVRKESHLSPIHLTTKLEALTVNEWSQNPHYFCRKGHSITQWSNEILWPLHICWCECPTQQVFVDLLLCPGVD